MHIFSSLPKLHEIPNGTAFVHVYKTPEEDRWLVGDVPYLKKSTDNGKTTVVNLRTFEEAEVYHHTQVVPLPRFSMTFRFSDSTIKEPENG